MIAGGGPAGLAAAIEAHRLGLEAVVVEPQTGPIDKACGEGLMPGAVQALERMGVTPEVSHPFRGIKYVGYDATAVGHFPALPGCGVRRVVLHAALEARVRALGIRREVGRVTHISQSDDHVVAGGFEARWLVAADGLRSPIRKTLGLGLPARGGRRIGLRRHYRRTPWSEYVEVWWGDDIEAYVTPVAEDTIGVALLFYPDASTLVGIGGPDRFDRLIERIPGLPERLASQSHSRTLGAGPFEQRLSRRVCGRVLLVGDASGYVDPLTGEGLHMGFDTAAAAVRNIRAGTPAQYERDWFRITRRYRWTTQGLLTITRHPWIRRRLVPTLRRLPSVFDYALAQLGRCGPADAYGQSGV